jgi:hypothetical protein
MITSRDIHVIACRTIAVFTGHVPIYLSIYLPIYLSLSTDYCIYRARPYLSIYLSIYLPTYLSLSLPITLSTGHWHIPLDPRPVMCMIVTYMITSREYTRSRPVMYVITPREGADRWSVIMHVDVNHHVPAVH